MRQSCLSFQDIPTREFIETVSGHGKKNIEITVSKSHNSPWPKISRNLKTVIRGFHVTLKFSMRFHGATGKSETEASKLHPTVFHRV